jgi:hypothetical protein
MVMMMQNKSQPIGKEDFPKFNLLMKEFDDDGREPNKKI